MLDQTQYLCSVNTTVYTNLKLILMLLNEMMAGIQGAGKTTATAKLANWALKQQYAKKVMLVAADVYRPAAIEQLRTLGAKLDVEVYFEAPPTDGSVASPVTICRRAFTKAKAEGFDLVIFDTAGRQVSMLD